MRNLIKRFYYLGKNYAFYDLNSKQIAIQLLVHIHNNFDTSKKYKCMIYTSSEATFVARASLTFHAETVDARKVLFSMMNSNICLYKEFGIFFWIIVSVDRRRAHMRTHTD